MGRRGELVRRDWERRERVSQGRERERGRETYRVKVNANGTDVGRSYGDHGEEAVAPAAEEGDALVEDEEVLKLVGHPGGDGEELACTNARGQRAPRYHDRASGDPPAKCLLFSTTQLVGEW